MKNKGFLGGARRLPAADHKGDGRPTALIGTIFAGESASPQEPQEVARQNADVPAAPDLSAERLSPRHSPSPQAPRRGRPPKKAEAKSDEKRFYFSLLVERASVDRVETLLVNHPGVNRSLIMRRAAMDMRAKLLADGMKKVPRYTPKDPVRVSLELRLPLAFANKIKDRDDPLDLEPITTVLGRHVARYYAQMLDSIGQRDETAPRSE
ncbi:hypothetical protein ORIO_21200 (plasmid) [Cereibacter azotoformans]|uniref:hypothetical protein n=1 Tax=Cereibacter azotoformans TaxID=43057 RepID=UPI001EEB6DF1|nr:hypothetical protein [Cereibacter azotoformans]ULB12311.1 hypothetical protein ORIO_21200 [Cereibacter azotoformans]